MYLQQKLGGGEGLDGPHFGCFRTTYCLPKFERYLSLNFLQMQSALFGKHYR
jgi:hypothetical protein